MMANHTVIYKWETEVENEVQWSLFDLSKTCISEVNIVPTYLAHIPQMH